MKLWRIALAVMICLTSAGIVSAFAGDVDFKVLSGKWTCPICDSKHLEGNQTECEAQGHTHVFKLNDGTMVSFVPSPRADLLIRGGGRHSCPIKICGFYNRKLHTIDVEAYAIDNQWTSWCEEHKQMDLCRGNGADHAPGVAETSAR